MTDILLIIWKVFVGVVLALVTIYLIITLIIKFIEFVKGDEGDDYRRK
ncbi:MAG: hypothetical protein J6T15_03930 [Bacilli bacterium]|nr:hypothetical protein [Bacilli bacterium]